MCGGRMKEQEETKDLQELKERIDRNEYLKWFTKELEEILAFRETVIDKVILILRECKVKDEKIRAALKKHFLLEDELIDEKLV